MNGKLIFEGTGPFSLPAPQGATAKPLSGSVEVRLAVLNGKKVEKVVFQMTPVAAQDFATALATAATQAKKA